MEKDCDWVLSTALLPKCVASPMLNFLRVYIHIYIYVYKVALKGPSIEQGSCFDEPTFYPSHPSLAGLVQAVVLDK